MAEAFAAMNRLSENDKARFAAVRNKAEKLGVLDINFSGSASADDLAYYERTAEVTFVSKNFFDIFPEKLVRTA